MEFDANALRSRLAGRRIGNLLHYRETVDSTNRVAMGLAREGAAEGTVVMADRQTAGKGRLQRVWQSPPGCNIYLSVILRPTASPSEASRLTLLAGVAIAEAIASICPAGVTIKWPNDVLIRGRKVCGILAEMATVGGACTVILGIGLNVNIRKEDFDPGHRDTATSLFEETGRMHCREDVVFLICEWLERSYESFRRKGFAPIREKWIARSDMTGKCIRVLFRDEVQEGVMAGIDLDGALLIADRQGDVRRILAGDATIIKD